MSTSQITSQITIWKKQPSVIIVNKTEMMQDFLSRTVVISARNKASAEMEDALE